MESLSRVYLYLHKSLSQKRFIHCVSTAACARVLARHFGVDDLKPFYAGLVHDIARETDEQELLGTVSRQKLGLNADFYLENPVMLHSFAGADILERDFGITDSSVLNAVRWHCCGHPLMDENAKIVYIADYIESTRKHISLEESKKAFSMGLDDALFFVLQHECRAYHNDNTAVSPDWKNLYDQLKKDRRQLK